MVFVVRAADGQGCRLGNSSRCAFTGVTCLFSEFSMSVLRKQMLGVAVAGLIAAHCRRALVSRKLSPRQRSARKWMSALYRTLRPHEAARRSMHRWSRGSS
jgi:hypothetical protein